MSIAINGCLCRPSLEASSGFPAKLTANERHVLRSDHLIERVHELHLRLVMLKPVLKTTPLHVVPDLSPSACPKDPAWEFTRQLTARLNDPVVDSARIIILGLYHARQGPSLRSRLRSVYRIASRLAPIRDRVVADKCDPDVLFVLPTTTPSSVLNLSAVMSAMSTVLLRSILILPEGVDNPPDGFPRGILSHTYRSLFGRIMYVERFRALRRAWNRMCRMLEVAHELDPRAAAAMRPFSISLLERLFEAELCALACARALAHWKPRCVVSTSDLFPFEHQMFVSAKVQGISTFLLQHGIIGTKYFPFYADKFLAWGDSDLKTMVDLGASADSIVVLGMPSSDRLFDTELWKRTNSARPRSLKILILSNIRPRGPEKPVDGLASFLKEVIPQQSGHHWTVRLHPTESDHFYRSLGKRVTELLTFAPTSASFEQTVKEADLCCTIASTSGLEAMLMQKPLLVFNADPWIMCEAWWPRYKGGTFISSPSDLDRYVKHILEDDGFREQRIYEQNEFLARRFSNLGCAAGAVWAFVEQHTMNLKTKGDDLEQGRSTSHSVQFERSLSDFASDSFPSSV